MTVPLFNVAIEQPEDVSDRHHRTFMRDALKGAAAAHLLTFARRHFERNPDTAPGGAYGYTERTKRHMIRKARKYGHQTPNVFSGREMLHVLSNARITGTFAKARVVYRALHTRDGLESERWIREMEAISPHEAGEATKHAHAVYHKAVDDFRGQRQRKRLRD